MVWYFVGGALKGMTALIVIVFVLVWVEVTQ